jgi:hypothetical protein
MTRGKEHDSAVARLEAVLVEQDRLSERHDAAIGTSTELVAYVGLRAAGDQVAAREAWLHWIDDESYRGLNAGPFELLAERLGGLDATKPPGKKPRRPTDTPLAVSLFVRSDS